MVVFVSEGKSFIFAIVGRCCLVAIWWSCFEFACLPASSGPGKESKMLSTLTRIQHHAQPSHPPGLPCMLKLKRMLMRFDGDGARELGTFQGEALTVEGNVGADSLEAWRCQGFGCNGPCDVRVTLASALEHASIPARSLPDLGGWWLSGGLCLGSAP